MSLFSSLYVGANGMHAQSRSTEIISNNIANMSTVGYKKSDTAFKEILGDADLGRGTLHGVGNVMATEVARIREQGAIQQTYSDTDLAITGNGMFTVSATADGTAEFLYTRAGQFNEDANGILRNSAGYALYGFTTDTDGVATGTDENGLVAIDLSIFETQFFETNEIDLSINLDASEERLDPHMQTVPQQLPIDNLNLSYSRSIEVYDNTGTAQDITFEYRHTIGPMAHFSSQVGVFIDRSSVLVDNNDGPTSAITAGDQLVISDGTDTLTIDFVNVAANLTLNEARTMGDVLDLINGFTGTGTTQLFEATITENNHLLVQSHNPTSSLDISGSSANVLSANGFNFPQDPDAVPDYVYEPDFDITDDYATSIYPGQSDFPAFSDTNTPNVFNWWELTIVSRDIAAGTQTTITQGLINFDSNGDLNMVQDANGESMITLAADDLPFSSTAGIDLEFSRHTQLSGTYQAIQVDQNGAPSGNRTAVTVDNEGTVSLTFGNDITLPVYQIPLAIFNNPDGLERVDGSSFRIPRDGTSGDALYALAGSNGAGDINASALENSNVDISDEFGSLIVSQRSYSMNSQVITAVNEMTQTLSQLKN